MPRYQSCNTSATITILRDVVVGEGDDASETTLEYRITVSGRYSPGRPPPPCSDHDHPSFSDPGDPPEFDQEKIEIEEVTDAEGEIVDEKHPLFIKLLKPEQIELTVEEDNDLYSSLSLPDYDDDGPDHDDY